MRVRVMARAVAQTSLSFLLRSQSCLDDFMLIYVFTQPIIQRQTQRIEHHHTSQIINEVSHMISHTFLILSIVATTQTHIKAPIVHNIIENAAISFEEFAGKLSELTHGKTGSSSGYSTGPTSGLTGSGSGLTDSKTHHTGTTGLTGSGGLTGEKHQEIGSTAPVRAAV